MVTILFDKCFELWNGCPAVEAMDNGIETAEEIPGDGNPGESELGLLPFAANDPAREDSTGVTTWDESAKDAVEKTVDARRNLISKLKKEKNSKLTKKTTTENRMLALGHEELQLKKRMIDQLEKSEEKYMESMQSFTASLHLVELCLLYALPVCLLTRQKDMGRLTLLLHYLPQRFSVFVCITLYQ